MRFLEVLQTRLRMLLYRKRELQRLDAELNFHLEQLTEENMARGMVPSEARQAALRAFGNPTRLREQAGESWSWNDLERLGNALASGCRTLSRTPGFALV